MKKRISVDVSVSGLLEEFLKTEGIQIDMITNGSSDVAVLRCDDRKESSIDTLYSGGWIACEAARALAKKLEISIMQMGRILNYLDVKIRTCSLGCF